MAGTSPAMTTRKLRRTYYKSKCDCSVSSRGRNEAKLRFRLAPAQAMRRCYHRIAEPPLPSVGLADDARDLGCHGDPVSYRSFAGAAALDTIIARLPQARGLT
jgi:hypothetical protein